ncbi:hypothetical protein, partial [Aeromonas caviae]|uniref:hypothetical protein n=1 Tax=Aeromonas caviae TaxID=648 RepID=UPI0019D418AE
MLPNLPNLPNLPTLGRHNSLLRISRCRDPGGGFVCWVHARSCRPGVLPNLPTLGRHNSLLRVSRNRDRQL